MTFSFGGQKKKAVEPVNEGGDAEDHYFSNIFEKVSKKKAEDSTLTLSWDDLPAQVELRFKYR